MEGYLDYNVLMTSAFSSSILRSLYLTKKGFSSTCSLWLLAREPTGIVRVVMGLAGSMESDAGHLQCSRYSPPLNR